MNVSATILLHRQKYVRIMRTYNFDIVAMWEAQASGRIEFVYLLKWPDEATMQI